jgi:hypothetical protein
VRKRGRRSNLKALNCKSAQALNKKKTNREVYDNLPYEISHGRRVLRTVSKMNLDQRNNLGENEESDNFEDEEMTDSKRKMRGLKRLSQKVKDLVKDLGPTTYSNVANMLIEQLRASKKGREEILGNVEISDDSNDEEMS